MVMTIPQRSVLFAALAALLFGLLSGAVLVYRGNYRPKRPADSVFERRARPDIDTLQVITRQAETDGEALAAVVRYYEQKRAYLSALWDETDDTRLRALYSMFVVHISHPYGVVNEPASTLLDYIRQQRLSHCQWQSEWQAVIATALDLDWRIVYFDQDIHGWLEVRVGDRYEVFDSTTNIWLSDSMLVLQSGAARTYKMLYTPILDPDFPEFRAHYAESNGHFDVYGFRQDVISFGLSWRPKANLVIGDTASGQLVIL